MTALLGIYSLWRRDLVRFLRQRSRVVSALATPILFWLVIGSGIGQSFRPADGSAAGGFLEYYFPGTVALIVLFTAIFSTISVIEDRHDGFLQGVLASPAPRLAIVLGKITGSATLAAGNAILFLALAPAAGLSPSPGALVEAVGVIALMSLGLSGLGVAIAWSLESTQGFHALMNLVLVPMWLLSGAFFPASGAAGWIRGVMAVNPLTYGVEALRTALAGSGAPGQIAGPALVMALFAMLTVIVATALASKPVRA
ncbi:MAG: ABC transporter permease [Vicinamibacterales bacterium]